MQGTFKSDFGEYSLYTAIFTKLHNPQVLGTVDWFGYVTLTFNGKDDGGSDAYVKYYVDPNSGYYLYLGSNLKWNSILQSYGYSN